MADSLENIPTLTDIMSQGNDDMLNHFDGHQLDEHQNDDDAAPLKTEKIEASPSESKKKEAQPSHPRDDEPIPHINNECIFEKLGLNDIPKINAHGEDLHDLPDNTFTHTTEVEPINEANQPDDIKTNAVDNAQLKIKIDQAIRQALPEIKALLTEKLYKEFNI